MIHWGGPIDRRIRHTLNSYANARKEPRRQYIHARTHRASVYTLRPVFCILSSELIQSRGPPGDFRCGEIVIVTRYFIELSHLQREREIVARDDCEENASYNRSRITLMLVRKRRRERYISSAIENKILIGCHYVWFLLKLYIYILF